jgi:hypothetical protein
MVRRKFTPEEQARNLKLLKLAFARLCARKRKQIHRESLIGGCVLLWPGTWGRPEDYFSDEPEQLSLPLRAKLRAR